MDKIPKYLEYCSGSSNLDLELNSDIFFYRKPQKLLLSIEQSLDRLCFISEEIKRL